MGDFFDTCQRYTCHVTEILKARQKRPCSDSFIINYLPRQSRHEVDVKFMWIGFVNAMGEMPLSLHVHGDKWKVNKVKI